MTDVSGTETLVRHEEEEKEGYDNDGFHPHDRPTADGRLDSVVIGDQCSRADDSSTAVVPNGCTAVNQDGQSEIPVKNGHALLPEQCSTDTPVLDHPHNHHNHHNKPSSPESPKVEGYGRFTLPPESESRTPGNGDTQITIPEDAIINFNTGRVRVKKCSPKSNREEDEREKIPLEKMDSQKAMEADPSHTRNGNGGTVAVSSPLTSEKLMPQSNGTRKSFEEYFIPVNTHKKLLRGEKLYLTKDDRKLCQGWKRVIICGFITIIIAVAILVGALAATGILLADSENKTTRHELNGHQLPNTASISQAGISLRPHVPPKMPKNVLPLTTMNVHFETTPSPRVTTYRVVSEATSQVNPIVPVLPEDSSESHTIVPNALVGEFTIIDENFTEDLYDNSSHGYLSLATHLEAELRKIFRRNGGSFEALKILSFRPGSIIVHYVVIWEDEQHVIRAKQATKILNTYLGNHNNIFLAFSVDVSSIKFTDVIDECQIQNGGCTHDCTWSYSTLSKHCSCPPGMRTAADGTTCEDFTLRSEESHVPEVIPVTTAIPEEPPTTTTTTTTALTTTTSTTTTGAPITTAVTTSSITSTSTAPTSSSPVTTPLETQPPIYSPPTEEVTHYEEPSTESPLTTDEILTTSEDSERYTPVHSMMTTNTEDTYHVTPIGTYTVPVFDNSSHLESSEETSTPTVPYSPTDEEVDTEGAFAFEHIPTDEEYVTEGAFAFVTESTTNTLPNVETEPSVLTTEPSTSSASLPNESRYSTYEGTITEIVTDVLPVTAIPDDGLKQSDNTTEFSVELETHENATPTEAPETTLFHESTTPSVSVDETSEDLNYRQPFIPLTTESSTKSTMDSHDVATSTVSSPTSWQTEEAQTSVTTVATAADEFALGKTTETSPAENTTKNSSKGPEVRSLDNATDLYHSKTTTTTKILSDASVVLPELATANESIYTSDEETTITLTTDQNLSEMYTTIPPVDIDIITNFGDETSILDMSSTETSTIANIETSPGSITEIPTTTESIEFTYNSEANYSDVSTLTIPVNSTDETTTQSEENVMSNTSSIWTLKKNTEIFPPTTEINNQTFETTTNDSEVTTPIENNTTVQSENADILSTQLDNETHTEVKDVTFESENSSIPLNESYTTTEEYNDTISFITSEEEIDLVNSTDIPEVNSTLIPKEDDSSEWVTSDLNETVVFTNFTTDLWNSSASETTLSTNFSDYENTTMYPETETFTWTASANNTTVFDVTGNYSSLEDFDLFNSTANETTTNATTGIECTGDEILCEVLNKCLSNTMVCDGIDDCPDGSDESDCEESCQLNFQCTNSTQCIMNEAHCDGIFDCPDGSDEKDCTPTECAKHEVMCLDGSTCIKPGHICDWKYNCKDRSDEIGCVERTTCETGERFFCNDGLCIPWSLKCDGAYDCKDKEDEGNCTCSEDDFKCYDGKCLKRSDRCNGYQDCHDGEDEMGCVTVDEKNTVSVYEPSSGSWSVLCGDDWTLEDGRYLCQELGFGHVLSVGTQHVSFNGTWMKMKRGNLSDNSLWTERVEPTAASCNSDLAATVMCEDFECGNYSQLLHRRRRRRQALSPSSPTSQWPFIAYISTFQSQKGCLSEILTPIWLVTSAECLLSIGKQPHNGSDWYVRTSVAKGLESNFTQMHEVLKIIPHPHSSKFRSLTLRDYDVALIRLKYALLFSDKTGAICLPEEQVPPGITCFSGVLGTEKARAPPPPSLSITSIALIVQDRENSCNSIEHYNKQVNSRMLCTRSSTDEAQRICDNDEGTPLMCLSGPNKWYLAGTLTYQRWCGVYNSHPAVFSNLFAMRPFIDQVIGQKQYNVPYDGSTYVIMPPTTPGPTEPVTTTSVYEDTTTEPTTETTVGETPETYRGVTLMKILNEDNYTTTESVFVTADNETEIYELNATTDGEGERLDGGTESAVTNGTELIEIHTEPSVNDTSLGEDNETISNVYINETESSLSLNDSLVDMEVTVESLTSTEEEYMTTVKSVAISRLPEEDVATTQSSLIHPSEGKASETSHLGRNQPLIALDDLDSETTSDNHTDSSAESYQPKETFRFDDTMLSDSAFSQPTGSFNFTLTDEKTSNGERISVSDNEDKEENTTTTSLEYPPLNDSLDSNSTSQDVPESAKNADISDMDSTTKPTTGASEDYSITTESLASEEISSNYSIFETTAVTTNEDRLFKENETGSIYLLLNETDYNVNNDSHKISTFLNTSEVPESTEEGSPTFSANVSTESKPKMAKMIYDVTSEEPTSPFSGEATTVVPLPSASFEEKNFPESVTDATEDFQTGMTAIPSEVSPVLAPTELVTVADESTENPVTVTDTMKMDNLSTHDSPLTDGYSVTAGDTTNKMADFTDFDAVNCGNWNQSLEKEVEMSSDGSANITALRWPGVGVLRMVSEPRFCVASIISSRSVLTSLSCLKTRDNILSARNWVFMGSHPNRPSDVSSLYHMVEEIIPCPYANLEPESLAGNDLALVILKDVMDFSQLMLPVCLPQELLDPNQKCFTVGWTTDSSDSEDVQEFLSMLTTVVSTEKCNDTVGYNGTLQDTVLCVISLNSTSSFNKLDTGAPLLCLTGSGTWEVQGVRTSVPETVPAQRPAPYSNVYSDKQWILDTLESIETNL